jgi:hypothetical protein
MATAAGNSNSTIHFIGGEKGGIGIGTWQRRPSAPQCPGESLRIIDQAAREQP